MAVELATAYVSIVPDTKGLGRQLIRQSNPQMSAAGSSMGSMLGRKLIGAIAALGVGHAIGKIITSGLNRALDIQDAKATLTTLGYDAAAIVDDTLEAVKGTPYALNDAVAAAASALAAGVGEGDELTGYLATIADAATVAKVPFSEMASVFDSVTATGKVSGDTLNRLGERGIPILQWLADEYGVSTEAMREMVSSGEVDSTRFQKAISDNVGGAALAAGDTVRGAFENTKAAFARSVADMIEPMLPAMKQTLDGVMEIVGVFEGFVNMLQNGETFLDAISITLAESFGVDFGPAKEQFESLGGAIRNLGEVVMPTISKWYDEIVKPAMDKIGAAFAPVAAEIIPTVTAIIDWVRENWPAIQQAIEPVMNKVVGAITGAMQVIGGIIRTVLAVIRGDWDAAGKGIKTAVDGIVSLLRNGPIGTAIEGAFSAVKNIGGWFEEMKRRVSNAVSRLWDSIKGKLQQIKGALANLNPFMRHSPSLVDNVLRGVKVIGEAYGSLSGMSIAGPSVSGVSAGYTTATAPAVGHANITVYANDAGSIPAIKSAVREVLRGEVRSSSMLGGAM